MFPHQYQKNYQSTKSGHNNTKSLPNGLSRQNYHTSNKEPPRTLEYFVDYHKINRAFAAKLERLRGYEIVFICDDSGSMNTQLNDVVGPYEKRQTRWDELKHTVSIVVNIASTLDPDGVDIYFLNRKPIFNVTKSEQLADSFAIPPQGATPLVSTLRRVLQDKKDKINTRKLLIIIATDGEPTDVHGRVTIEEFRHVLQYERIPIKNVPVTIMACTDVNSIDYLNNWDKQIDHLDVVDDYKNEKNQILACQGANFPFSYGDYVVKILMGPIDKWFDDLDEKPVSIDGYVRPTTKTRPSNNTYKPSYSSSR